MIFNYYIYNKIYSIAIYFYDIILFLYLIKSILYILIYYLSNKVFNILIYEWKIVEILYLTKIEYLFNNNTLA